MIFCKSGERLPHEIARYHTKFYCYSHLRSSHCHLVCICGGRKQRREGKEGRKEKKINMTKKEVMWIRNKGKEEERESNKHICLFSTNTSSMLSFGGYFHLINQLGAPSSPRRVKMWSLPLLPPPTVIFTPVGQP
jgi:hypothetical protein